MYILLHVFKYVDFFLFGRKGREGVGILRLGGVCEVGGVVGVSYAEDGV